MVEAGGQIAYREKREYSLVEKCLRARRLDLPTWMTLAAAVVAVSLAVFHIFVAGFGTPETLSFRSTHLEAMLILAFLVKPLFREGISEPVYVPGGTGNGLRIAGLVVDLALIVVVIAIQLYILEDTEELQARSGALLPSDIVVGTALLVIVLEATRRTVGWAMVCIALFFTVQTLFSQHLFGIFYRPPVPYEYFIEKQFVDITGIFGIPIFVASTYVVLFIIFGAILIRSSAGLFFIELAVALTGHRLGGPAKASVVASAFLGTVSGSATANVVTTGSFTIPLMKKLGYRPRFAAAVEACASSGGQITPPIMGAAAFIIAQFLSVPYLTVVVAAIIPTFLYFSTMYFMVHLEADKHGIAMVPKSRLPSVLEVLRWGWHLLFSLIVLVALLVSGRTAVFAGFWSILVLVVLTFFNAKTRMSPVDLLAALETGIRSALQVSIACGCAGIIIGCIFVSGLGLSFTNSIIELSGGSLFVLLILTGLAAILLGMGLTTTAVYITVAALIVPALVKMGVEPMAAHLFAFYYGVVSSITPPVALASFAAAAIAGTKAQATAVESARVGIAKYLVPFIFVYNPSLLFEGPLWLTAYSGVTAFAGVWLLSVSLEGWYRGPLSAVSRVPVGLAAIGLMYPPLSAFLALPGYTLNVLGATVAVGIFVNRIRASAARPPLPEVADR